MKSKVLITGASGFVGGRILEGLLKDGRFEVSVLLRNPDGFKKPPESEKLAIYKGDITDPDTLKGALSGKEVIIHCAALMSSFDSEPRGRFYEVNVRGTENCLHACNRGSIRQFVHISTAGVYGPCRDGPADEDAPYGSVLSDYEWSKKEAEVAVLRRARADNIPYTILRLSQLYGAGMRYGWVDTVKAIKAGRMLIPGKDEGLIHLLDIRDVVEAVRLVVLNESAMNRIYNIAGPEALKLAEVFDAISEMVGARRPARIPLAPAYAASFALGLLPAGLKGRGLALVTPHRLSFFSDKRYYDTSRARSELNFAAAVKVGDGLREMIDWCGREGLI